ncbi:hypothetical protein RhiJN_21289 [Ceratobasidium sp. AG-Ba]|nr:hypothetical protein RhiJN_21289 [Ceratobasidium sp. AG-Ba]
MYFVELAKYFVFTILACFDTSTYVGMTAIDLGARAIHASAYVGLSRTGLQLPVGAFVPPPPPLSAGSVMLYVTPAAVASWPSVVDALYHVPKALDIGYQTVRHVAATLAAHHQRLAPSLIHVPPSFLTTSQSAYVSASWSRPTVSSPGLPSPAYRPLTFPTFNLSSSSTLLPDILGSSPADHRAPFLAAIGLGQRTPRGVLPIQQEPVTPDMQLGDARSLVVYRTPMPTKLERSIEVVVNESSPSSDQTYQATETVIIIHLRSCLIGLFVLSCLLIAVYMVLRRTLRLVRWICSRFFVAVRCTGVLSLLWIAAKFTAGVCTGLLARRKAVQAAPIGSDANCDTHIPPPSPLLLPSTIQAASTHAPLVESVTPPTPTPDEYPSPKPAGKKKKNKKNKKKKAGLGSVTVVDPVDVPLPPDDGQSWAVSPTMVPLPLSSPPSPILDAVTPPLSLPPAVSNIDPLLAGVPSVSPIETVRADNEPPKDSTAPIDASFAPPSEQTGVAFTADGESGQDHGGDWIVVERKRKPRRALQPIPGAAPTLDRKAKRGGRAGEKPEWGNQA